MTTTIKDLLTAIKDANVGENDGVQVETDTETFYDLQFDRKNNALAIHVKDDRDLQGRIDKLEAEIDGLEDETTEIEQAAKEALEELQNLREFVRGCEIPKEMTDEIISKIDGVMGELE